MNRRKAMKVTAGLFAGSGVGLITLANAFKKDDVPDEKPYKPDYNKAGTDIKYCQLNPEATAELAYQLYSEGSCMYATFSSIASQLAEKIGEPYASVPFKMFKYGHGGVGGYGTLCGALNGAAAICGLLFDEKDTRDRLITDIFQWYEKTTLPLFIPQNPKFDSTLPSVASNSVLCHAANTNWCNETGFGISSEQRKEKCRRLTADVVLKLTTTFNEVFAGRYVANTHGDKAVSTCNSCHGNEGKLKNVSGKMSCNSCHTESVGHKIFADVHYKVMKE